MKTAVIVAGVCRFTDIAHKSWNIFPDADWYLSTWDITQQPYSAESYSSIDEVNVIKDKFKHIEISNYNKEYLDIKNISAYARPFILLEKILNIIKEQQYQRIIYFRPDLVLFNMNNDLWPNLQQFTLDDFNENDFSINDNVVKIAGDHDPDCWVDHEKKILHDSFFVFSLNSFLNFLNNKEEIIGQWDIHRSLYNYFEKYNITVEPLSMLRTVILRNNILDNLDKTSWGDLCKLFVKEYTEKNYLGKFTHMIDLQVKTKPDYEKISESQASGGILKLRNK